MMVYDGASRNLMDEYERLRREMEEIRERLPPAPRTGGGGSPAGVFSDAVGDALETILQDRVGVKGRRTMEDIASKAASKMVLSFMSQFRKGGTGGSLDLFGAGVAGGTPPYHPPEETYLPGGWGQDGRHGRQRPSDMTGVLDAMIANALLNGRQTSSILKSVFNLMPGLIGR